MGYELYNIDTDAAQVYQQYTILPAPTTAVSIGGGVAITTINGVTGPTINFQSSVQGISFVPAGTNVQMIGAPAQIQEDSTVLDVGAIADGEFLKRVGDDIVGASAPSGGGTLDIVSTQGDLALSDSNDVVLVDTSINPVTVLLHNPNFATQKRYDIKLATDGNMLTIDGNGFLIDGSGSVSFNTEAQSLTLIPDNATSQWYII